MNPRLQTGAPAETALEKSNERLRLLADTAGSLLMVEDPQTLIRGIFTRLAAHLGLEIYLHHVAEEGRRLRLNCYGGLTEAEAERLRRLEFGESVCGRAAARQEIVVREDVRGSSDPEAEIIREAGITAYACFPLIGKAHLVGTLSFGTRSRPRFEKDELALMRTIAGHAAVAMERKRWRDEMSRRDGELERHSHLLELAHVVVHDAAGVILFWKRGAEEMFGWSEEEALGKNVHELLHTEFPQPLDEIRRTVAEQGNWTGELQHRRRDGGQVVTASHWALHRESDGSEVILEVNNDITVLREAEAALRESEERYRALADFVPVFVFTANPEGDRDFVNQRWRDYTGLEPDTAEGQTWLTAVHPGDRVIVERKWSEAIQAGIVFEATYRLRARDGSYRWFLGRAVPLRDARSRIRKWFGTAMDIEVHVRMEEAVRRAQQAESIGVLAGGVAHRFNNLLTGIIGGTSIAVETLPEGSPARPMLEGVAQSAQKAAELTGQLLAYAGKGRFVEEPVNLSALVEDVRELLQTGIPPKIRLRLELRRDMPRVLADAGQMRQVVLGLVMNAAEAIGDQPGTVRVTTGTARINTLVAGCATDLLSPGEYAFLEVSDTGCGMDGDIQSRIFEPFFTTKFMGRGLGLPAALGIVRAQKGAIHYQSTPGKGSTFRVLLPLSPASPREAAIEPKGATVLVVDDEEIVRVTARAILERAGYTVLLAENGLEALETFSRASDETALVLLDMAMPVMGGEETLQHLHRLRPDLPVLVATGYDESEAVRRFQGQNVAGFVQKPFTARQLSQRVAEVLGQEGE